MLNEMIEKLAGMTWEVLKTGSKAMVQINEEMRAVIELTRGDVFLQIEYRYERSTYGGYEPWYWSCIYRPPGGSRDDEEHHHWSTRLDWGITPDQANAMRRLFNKVVTNGSDSRVSNIIAMMG